MATTVGTLIKEARTGAKLTQEALANQVEGLTAADLSKAERGQKDLTQAQLKAIAKATGVTQSSLLNAAKAEEETAAKKTAAKKTETKKTQGKKTETAKKTESKKPASQDAFALTAAEKKLVELYRAADSDTKKAAMNLLKGIEEETPNAGDLLSTLLGGAMDLLGKK